MNRLPTYVAAGAISILIGLGLSAWFAVSQAPWRWTAPTYRPEPCQDWTDSHDLALPEGRFGAFLEQIGEPSIRTEADRQGRESYRFIWLRSFHETILVRIYRDAGTMDGTLILKILYTLPLGADGTYPPPRVREARSRVLELTELDAVRALYASLWAWDPPRQPEYTTDGSWWIIEHARPEARCTIHDRNGRSDEVRALGLHMLDLAGYETLDVY